MKEEIKFDADNEDAAETSVYWYDDSGAFIYQLETDNTGDALLLVGREGVPRLIEALQQFLVRSRPTNAGEKR